MKFSDLWRETRREIEQRIAFETSPERPGRYWPYVLPTCDSSAAKSMRTWNAALDELARNLYADADFTILDLSSISPGMVRVLCRCVEDAVFRPFPGEILDLTEQGYVAAQTELLGRLHTEENRRS